MAKYLNRGDFLAACQRRYGEFTMPSTGQVVRYRSLSEAEFAKFEMDRYTIAEEGPQENEANLLNMRERLIVLCLCDADGKRLLNDGDLEAVGQLDAGDTGLLYLAIREHCGLAASVREAKAKRDSQKKTSNGTSGNDSPTNSPRISES